MKEYALLLLLVVLMPAVYAHCPLCTAAVGSGVVVTRFYGIDDAIVGVWIGAFVVSTALWFDQALKKRYKSIRFQSLGLVFLALLLTIVPFYFSGLMGQQKILGVNKLLVGILSGSIATYAGILVSEKIKKRKGKALFPFQTITIILAFLSLASFLFWCIPVFTG